MKKYFQKICRKSKEDFFKEVSLALNKQQKMFVVTANPETLMIGQANSEFDKILKKATTTIVPDGIGVVKAANMLGIPLKERITGVDLVSYLLGEANRQHKSLFMYGAKENVLAALVHRIKKEFPYINICDYYNGYDHNDTVLELAIDKKADIVLVALGIPRQEILIDKYFDSATKGIFIGVGGSFDVLSGTKKRAPKFFVKCNLEWLYRIIKEPTRFKRFYQSNVKFLGLIRKMKKDGVTYE